MKKRIVSLVVFHKDRKVLLQNREKVSKVGEEWDSLEEDWKETKPLSRQQ